MSPGALFGKCDVAAAREECLLYKPEAIGAEQDACHAQWPP